MKNNVIKICMIADFIPPDYSGAGRQALQLANALLCKNIQTNILTQTKTKTKNIIISSPKYTHLCSSSYFTIWSIMWLIINKTEYDIIHLHGLRRCTWSSILIANFLKKPILFKYTLPSCESYEIINQTRFGNVKCKIFNKLDAFIALSSNSHTSLKNNKNTHKKTHYIPNGVDCNIYNILSRDKREARKIKNFDFGWPMNSNWVIYLGGIEARKGIDCLLESWKLIINKVCNARLLLVGPDTHASGYQYKNKLIQYINDNNLTPSVHFYGKTDTPQDLLPLADVFVLPTQSEGLPNALLEAQACGVPAVASYLEGVTTDIVREGETGLLTPVGNASALAEALISVLTDAKWRSPEKQAAIRRHCVERFSIDQVAAQYAELYRKLLG